MQTQNYPKGGLLDTMCPSTAAPSALRSEQEFPIFPKSRMDTVSVNYCSLSQDFTGSNLSLLTNGSGKETLQAGLSVRLGFSSVSHRQTLP